MKNVFGYRSLLVRPMKTVLLLILVIGTLFFSPVGCGDGEDACDIARRECTNRGTTPRNCNKSTSGCTEKCECDCYSTSKSTISGNIASVDGSAELQGITVTASTNDKEVMAAIALTNTDTVETDTKGNYILSLSKGTYTITPFKCGYTFVPPTQTIDNDTDVTLSFEVQKEKVISGEGTINLKENCWIITDGDGCLYNPANLADKFKKNGLVIKFDMRLTNVESDCDGIPTEIMNLSVR